MYLVKNLGLVLDKVEIELNNKFTPATKTLMNTYLNLLQQFRNNFDFTNKTKVAMLSSHQKRLTSLLEIGFKETSYFLNSEDYRSADNMVMVTQRIESALTNIKYMINDYKRFMNLPQNKEKVLIGYDEKSRPIYTLIDKEFKEEKEDEK